MTFKIRELRNDLPSPVADELKILLALYYDDVFPQYSQVTVKLIGFLKGDTDLIPVTSCKKILSYANYGHFPQTILFMNSLIESEKVKPQMRRYVEDHFMKHHRLRSYIISNIKKATAAIEDEEECNKFLFQIMKDIQDLRMNMK